MAEKEMILDKIIEIVGDEHVSGDAEDLIAYQKACPIIPEVSGGLVPDYVVMPGCVEEVQKLVFLANEYMIPIYPYGYGTWFFAIYKPGIVLDLRRLNKIIKIDEVSMTAIIEAGVSQGELIREARKIGLDAPPNLGPGTGSLVSNFSSHGGGSFHVGKDDYIAVEAVLPSGKIIRTGSWGSPVYADTIPYIRYAFGPDITGLLRASGGGFGIVTKAIYRLHPLREAEEHCEYAFRDVLSAVEFGIELDNMGITHYKFGASRKELLHWICDPPELMFDHAEYESLLSQLPEWVDIIGFSGTRAQVDMYKNMAAEKAIKGGGEKFELSDKRMNENLNDLAMGCSLVVNRMFTYPAHFLAGMMSIAKMEGFHQEVMDMIKEYDVRDPFFPDKLLDPPQCIVGIPFVSNDNHFYEHDIEFDPTDPESLDKFKIFYEAATERLVPKYGLVPIMMNPVIINMLDPPYADLLRDIKMMLDPNGIAAPGKFL